MRNMGRIFLATGRIGNKTCPISNPLTGERYAFAGGFRYEGQPIILSEFGGIAFCGDEKAWGYGNAETSEGSYLERLNSLTDAGYIVWILSADIVTHS